jgi:hypothetical protein
MLRASTTATATPLDLRGVLDATVDPLVPAGVLLRDSADAVIDRDRSAWARARAGLTDRLGPAAPAAAAGVAANFQMMNRLLDATGVPVPQRRVELGRALGMEPC